MNSQRKDMDNLFREITQYNRATLTPIPDLDDLREALYDAGCDATAVLTKEIQNRINKDLFCFELEIDGLYISTSILFLKIERQQACYSINLYEIYGYSVGYYDDDTIQQIVNEEVLSDYIDECYGNIHSPLCDLLSTKYQL
jgi:hypothetical protein